MIRVKSISRFIYGLLPFCIRKSKTIRCLVNSITDVLQGDVVVGQANVDSLKKEGRYRGQVQVVSERIVELFGEGIVVRDGSDGNVVIVGRESPYIQIIRNDVEGMFLALPMERTTVGVDFVVEIPSGLADNEAEIRNWLNGIVFAGVGFEVKIV